MKKEIMERFESYLKDSRTVMPDIRWFDGTESFSDSNGKFKAKSLQESLDLFLTARGF